jgi:hypothetical protein
MSIPSFLRPEIVPFSSVEIVKNDPQAQLVTAARRVLKLLDAQIAGQYYGPSEDISAARELAAALRAVEDAR